MLEICWQFGETSLVFPQTLLWEAISFLSLRQYMFHTNVNYTALFIHLNNPICFSKIVRAHRYGNPFNKFVFELLMTCNWS